MLAKNMMAYPRTLPVYFSRHNHIYNMLYGFDNGFFKPKVITISGSTNDENKEYMANYLSRRYSYEKIRFQDSIKDITRQMFNFSDEQLDTHQDMHKIDPLWNITPKQAIDFVNKGICLDKIKDMIPDIDDRFVAKLLISKISAKNQYVIPDLHKYSEYIELCSAKIKPFVLRIDEQSCQQIYQSQSEYLMIPYDILLINDEHKEKMIKKLNDELSELL
jgi:hypothetical protein